MIGVFFLVVLIVASVIITVAVTFNQCLVYAPSEANVRYGASDDKGNNYAYFESAVNVGIYKLSDKNKVMGQVVDSSVKPWDGGKVLGLLVSSRTVYLPVRTQAGVKLFAWNEDLEKDSETVIPFSPDVKIAGITLKNETLYIVALENDGESAVVYSAKKGGETVSVYNEQAADGTRFLDAYYINGRLESLFSDGSRSAGYNNASAQRTVLPDNVGFMGISLGFPTVIRNVLILAAIIFLIVFFFRAVVFKRNYTWLKIYGFMFVFSICLSFAVYLMTDTVCESRIAERMGSSEYIISTYAKGINSYDGSIGTKKYYDAYTEISRITDTYGTIADIAAVTMNNSRAMVAVSTRIPFGEWLSGTWGEVVDECIVKSHSHDNAQWGFTTIGGQDYMTVVVPVNDDLEGRCFLAGLVRYEDIKAQNSYDVVSFIAIMGIVWGAALFIVIFINFIRAKELKAVANTITRISRGEQTEVVRPLKVSKDFEIMWNAASELAKSFGKNVYLKNQTLLSASRFAPQNIEKLLGKDSVSDVRLGDKGSVHGTVALIEITRPFTRSRSEYMDLMSTNIELLCRYKNEYSGVLISDSATMCSSRMLFAQDEGKAIAFGVRTSDAIEKSSATGRKKSIILLHKTDYEYGITGSGDQNFACISSTQLDALSDYVPKLLDLGIRLAVTEEVLADSSVECASRYIGYIVLPDNGGEVRIYEVLDAESMEERNRKKATLGTFGKALELYYASDFYLARNLFAEAVKECPEDLVARWYLFKCEGMLDGGDIEKFCYGLLSE